MLARDDLNEISGRAVAFMEALARERYGYAGEAIAFAKTHLDDELLRWVKGYEGNLAGVIDNMQDRDIPAHQLPYGGTPDQQAAVATAMLWLVARGLLRDGDPKYSSQPDRRDKDRVERLVVSSSFESAEDGVGCGK